jgi:hypothetical protein
MNKKAGFLIMLILALSICSYVVLAASNPLEKVNELVLSINPNPDLELDIVSDNPALWTFAVFTIVFAIVYAASAMLPIFKDNRGPRVTFCVVLGLISVVAPGAIRWISQLGSYAIVALVLVAMALIFLGGAKGLKGPKKPQGISLPKHMKR